jgi:hypothetical protein
MSSEKIQAKSATQPTFSSVALQTSDGKTFHEAIDFHSDQQIDAVGAKAVGDLHRVRLPSSHCASLSGCQMSGTTTRFGRFDEVRDIWSVVCDYLMGTTEFWIWRFRAVTREIYNRPRAGEGEISYWKRTGIYDSGPLSLGPPLFRNSDSRLTPKPLADVTDSRDHVLRVLFDLMSASTIIVPHAIRAPPSGGMCFANSVVEALIFPHLPVTGRLPYSLSDFDKLFSIFLVHSYLGWIHGFHTDPFRSTDALLLRILTMRGLPRPVDPPSSLPRLILPIPLGKPASGENVFDLTVNKQ